MLISVTLHCVHVSAFPQLQICDIYIYIYIYIYTRNNLPADKSVGIVTEWMGICMYRGADKSLALPRRKQTAPVRSAMGRGMDFIMCYIAPVHNDISVQWYNMCSQVTLRLHVSTVNGHLQGNKNIFLRYDKVALNGIPFHKVRHQVVFIECSLCICNFSVWRKTIIVLLQILNWQIMKIKLDVL